MTSPVERPYGSRDLGSKYQGQSTPTDSQFFKDFEASRRTPKGRPTALNDSVDWSADLGGGTRIALIQAAVFTSDAGADLRARAAHPVGEARRG